MSESESKLTLKFKQEFYDAVPHLYDSATTKGKDFTQSPSEVQICKCAIGGEPPAGHFICKNPDGVRWYFIQSHEKKAHLFDDFKDMLAVQCQQDPILTDSEGYVLDGYVRWLACIKLGIAPKHQIANAYLPDDDAKISWIRSRKLARHNLSERQRMQIVVAEIKAHPTRSNSWTAEALGVSRNTVIKYRTGLEMSGELQDVTKLIGKDGREYEYRPEKPPTKEQMEDLKKRSAERSKALLLKKANEVLGNNLLQPKNAGKSLMNIRKYLEQVDVPEYERDYLKEVKAAIDKKLPPMHEENLAEQYAGTALRKIQDFLKTAKYLTSQSDELLKVRDLIDKQVPPAVLEKHTASVTASTAWNVQTVDMGKTKAGVSIKFKPDNTPDKADVVEGVRPGQIIVNGKVINFEEGKALLLMPFKAQDATVTSEPPSEDDLMIEQGTVDPSSAVG